MKSVLLRLVLTTLLVYSGALLLVEHRVAADHQIALPLTPTKVMLKALERGYITYALNTSAASYPGFREQAAQVADAGLRGVGIPAVEVSGSPDVWLIMPTDQEFLSVCGSGAAGCIIYWTDPVLIYFRRALFYSDWKTTIAHEGINYGHTWGQHERYFDNGEFRCDFQAKYTVMSCGTGIWEPQWFDIATVWNLTVPDRPSDLYVMVAGNWATIRWNQLRADGGVFHGNAGSPTNPLNDTATRMTFAVQFPGEDLKWAGEICGPEYNFCYTRFSEGYRGFDAFWIRPGTCFYVRAENTILWWVGQRSVMPDYWTLAGCI